VIDAAAEKSAAMAPLDFGIHSLHSFILSYTETQSHGKLSAKNTAYRGDTADDATGGDLR